MLITFLKILIFDINKLISNYKIKLIITFF